MGGISCVLLSWNSAHYLEPCLLSLDRELRAGARDHEIIVIDNGSRDESVRVLRQLQSRGLPLRIVLLGRNHGTTLPRNIGLRMAAHEHIAVLDSDIELIEANTFERLLASLESNTTHGIVAPRLVYPSWRHQKSVDRFPTLPGKLRRLLFLRAMERSEEERTKGARPEIREVDYAISAFWLFRGSLLSSVGFLDEKIFYSPEDADFCLRCRKQGYTVVYDPRVTVMHHAQEIGRRVLGRASLSHAAGLLYFFAKHRCWFAPGTRPGRGPHPDHPVHRSPVRFGRS